MIFSILDFIFTFIQSGNVYPKILGYFLKNFPFPPFALFFLKKLLLLEVTSFFLSFSSFLYFGDTLWLTTQLYLPLLLLNLFVLYFISKSFLFVLVLWFLLIAFSLSH